MSRKFRNFVTFDAAFPDDSEWGTGGIAVVPGGKGIAQAIRQQLSNREFSCSPVEQHSFYGWAFEARKGDSSIRCLLQFPGPWLLTCDQRMSFLERLLRKGQDGDMQNYLTTLEDVLNADKRFSNIRWHFKSDYECGKENRAAISPY